MPFFLAPAEGWGGHTVVGSGGEGAYYDWAGLILLGWMLLAIVPSMGL